MKRKFIALAFLLLTCQSVAAPKQQPLEFIDINGSTSIFARGINKAGDVSGSYYSLSESNERGFIRKASGEIITLAVPGSEWTRPWGLDDEGRATGTFWRFGSTCIESFLYQGGQYSTLLFPGSTETYAYGVNAGGQVAGFTYTAGEAIQFHGFLLAAGKWTQLDYPGSLATFAFSVSPTGKVYGIWDEAPGKRHGFVYAGGQYKSIDFPGINTVSTEVYGANGSDSLIGGVYNGGCNYEPFTTNAGRFLLLDLTGAIISGINDSGYIVGNLGSKGFIAKASAFTVRK